MVVRVVPMMMVMTPEEEGAVMQQGSSLPLSLQSRLRFAYNSALQNDL